MRLAAALVAFALAAPAWADEGATWPPPGEAAARMRELQGVIASPDSTRAQRDAARAELGRLLMSPAGRERGAPAMPPRAAVQPSPPIAPPAPYTPRPAPPAGDVARIEVVEPPKLVVHPRTGAVVVPAVPAAPQATPPAFGVDPRTGAVVHPAGNGYVDPRTGQFTPR